MQENTTTEPINNFVQINSQNQRNVSYDTAMGISIIIIPMILFVGFNAYKRYRAAVLRQEIVSLEKLWNLDINRTYALGYSWRSGTGHRGGSAILGFPQVEQLPSWGIGEFFGPGACRPMPNPNP